MLYIYVQRSLHHVWLQMAVTHFCYQIENVIYRPWCSLWAGWLDSIATGNFSGEKFTFLSDPNRGPKSRGQWPKQLVLQLAHCNGKRMTQPPLWWRKPQKHPKTTLWSVATLPASFDMHFCIQTQTYQNGKDLCTMSWMSTLMHLKIQLSSTF